MSNIFGKAAFLKGPHRQEFWCSECDGVKVDSEKPESGTFSYTHGHEWKGVDGGGVRGNWPMVVFSICTACLPRFKFDVDGEKPVVEKSVVEALEAAYTRFGDFTFDWPGRITSEGQAFLNQLRGALAIATGRSEQDVQNDYGTRAHKARLAKEGK